MKRSARDVKWVKLNNNTWIFQSASLARKKRNTSEDSIFFWKRWAEWAQQSELLSENSNNNVNNIASKHGTIQKAFSNTTRQTWRILPPNINFEVWQLLKQSTKLKTFNLKSTTQDFLPFFKTSPLFSRLFPGIENYWANFQEFKTLYEPCWYCEYMGISRAHTMNLKYSSHWQGT